MDSDDNETSNEETALPRTTTLLAPSFPKAPKTKKGNGRAGTSNYSREELLSLLSVMERILPIGTEEWDQVVREHSKQYPGRDVKSIQRKYNTLRRKQVPSGSPNIPPKVLAAKRVKYKIGRKAVFGGEEANFDIETGFTGQEARQVLSDRTSTTLQPTNELVARRPSTVPVASSPVVPYQASREEFMDMLRMNMAMKREERLMQMAKDREERLMQMAMDREERRERHQELARLVTAVVVGIAAAFGVTPVQPSTSRRGTRKRRYDGGTSTTPINIRDSSSGDSSVE